MSEKRFFCSLIGIFLLFLAVLNTWGQTPTPEPTLPVGENPVPTASSQKTAESVRAIDLIHLGDLIDIDVVGSVEFDWRGRLNPEGFLSGIVFTEEPIYGLCRSEADVANQVAKGIDKFLTNPQVNVRILDRSGRPETELFGAVKTAHRFQMRRAARLNELLVISGGITENASGIVKVMRSPNRSCQSEDSENNNSGLTVPTEKYIQAKQQPETKYYNVVLSDLLKGKADANLLILGGDTITVVEAQPVYVTGGVLNPRKLNVNSQLTLSRALDAAGGFSKNAVSKKILVFRQENNETKVLEINYDEIKADGQKDFLLQPYDVVEVSQKGKESSRFPHVIDNESKSSIKQTNLLLRIIE